MYTSTQLLTVECAMWYIDKARWPLLDIVVVVRMALIDH